MILSSTLPHFTLVLVSSDIQRVLEFPVFFSLVLPLSSLSWDTSRLEPNPAKGSREQLIKLLQRECTGLEQKDYEDTRHQTCRARNLDSVECEGLDPSEHCPNDF